MKPFLVFASVALALSWAPRADAVTCDDAVLQTLGSTIRNAASANLAGRSAWEEAQRQLVAGRPLTDAARQRMAHDIGLQVQAYEDMANAHLAAAEACPNPEFQEEMRARAQFLNRERQRAAVRRVLMLGIP
jgi:hypothetical protein